MALYRTMQGDMLDLICWRHYGRTSGVVEAVLECNPRLALHPTHLPMGLLVLLPDLSPPSASLIRLWS